MNALGIYTELVFPQQGNPGAAGPSGSYVSPSGVAIVNGTPVVIPANKQILSIAVTATAGARTLTVGTTNAGSEVLDAEPVPSNTDYNFPVGIFTSTGLTLYFSGFTGTVRVYLL